MLTSGNSGGEILDPSFHIVEAFGKPAELFGHLALDQTHQFLGCVAATLDQGVDQGGRLLLAHFALLDEILDDRFCLRLGHVGECHAGFEQAGHQVVLGHVLTLSGADGRITDVGPDVALGEISRVSDRRWRPGRLRPSRDSAPPRHRARSPRSTPVHTGTPRSGRIRRRSKDGRRP